MLSKRRNTASNVSPAINPIDTEKGTSRLAWAACSCKEAVTRAVVSSLSGTHQIEIDGLQQKTDSGLVGGAINKIQQGLLNPDTELVLLPLVL